MGIGRDRYGDKSNKYRLLKSTLDEKQQLTFGPSRTLAPGDRSGYLAGMQRWPSDPIHGAREPGPSISLGQLGMVLTLVSIGILFAAACAAVVIAHSQATVWKASQAPFPFGLLGSTLPLAGAGIAFELAQRRLKQNQPLATARQLKLAAGCAAIFLLTQVVNSRVVTNAPAESGHALFRFAFNLLIGLHAAHVVGGLVALALCLSRTQRGEYSSSRVGELRYCTQYWHFLGGLWVPLVATLCWVR